ncbi:MAG: tRNA (adenosine(37)-N6)-dimethylallyltransferase MiaA, partial [Candidatus Omnitrophica bacterium]|nr:tRNA (adenosine(37)-N6)-dimethylallyltransferase MiaA [Candidatus Omnitrophota bacterium]
MTDRPKIIFIVGPTGSGKSDVAIKLSEKLNPAIQSEIVSCDSMLVYKEPAILVAKPGPADLSAVAHHMVGVVSVENSYSVYQYYRTATELIGGLVARQVMPIVCGGTGLYVKALVYGLAEGPTKDESVRAKLYAESETVGGQALLEKLRAVDPKTAETLFPNDIKRVVRALEVYMLTGIPMSDRQPNAAGLAKEFELRLFGIRYNRETLYGRINQRTEKMFEDGAIEEAERLLKSALSQTAKKIIGLEEIKRYLDGAQTLDEAKEA